MNYGFRPGPGQPTPELDRDDEPDRFCIQLYHHVASAVDLTGARVLEVGSGRGGGASFVRRYLSPERVTGVDFSGKAVALCQTRHSIDGLEFCRGNAEALPFENETFDAVLNVESSHCYGSPGRFFDEASRVLCAGGHFLFADFRAKEDTEELDSQLSAAGLVIRDKQDITGNVLEAMKADSERKQTLIDQHISGWLRGTFRQFAGLAQTQVYQSFVDRDLVYLCYRLQKPHTI